MAKRHLKQCFFLHSWVETGWSYFSYLTATFFKTVTLSLTHYFVFLHHMFTLENTHSFTHQAFDIASNSAFKPALHSSCLSFRRTTWRISGSHNPWALLDPPPIEPGSRLMHFLSIHSALERPYLQYGTQVWGPLYKCCMDLLRIHLLSLEEISKIIKSNH